MSFFGFEGGIWVLIFPIPCHCIPTFLIFPDVRPQKQTGVFATRHISCSMRVWKRARKYQLILQVGRISSGIQFTTDFKHIAILDLFCTLTGTATPKTDCIYFTRELQIW